MNTCSCFRRLVAFGTPIAIAILGLFHPTATTSDVLTDLGHRLPIWMMVHLPQLPLFGLMALAANFLLASTAGGYSVELADVRSVNQNATMDANGKAAIRL